MPAHLPRWVWIGAVALACVAGMINAVGFLSFEHQSVTHLTGTTTLFGTAIAEGEITTTLRLLSLLLAFLFGAALSGLIIQDSTLRLGRRYGAVLALESVLLFAATPLFKHQHVAGILCAAMACGLQNAMATTYTGAVVRTTHISGMFTDLGIGLGHALRRMPLAKRRLQFSGLVIAGFLMGAIFGALAFERIGYNTLLVPASLTGLIGFGYSAYRHFTTKHNPQA